MVFWQDNPKMQDSQTSSSILTRRIKIKDLVSQSTIVVFYEL